MIDREQQIVDRPVDPADSVMLLPAAGGHDQHCALPSESALAMVTPSLVAVLADAIGEPIEPPQPER
jgi:hypothetical protein